MNITDLILRRLNPNYELLPLMVTKIDYSGRTIPIPLYIGFAPQGTATSDARWVIAKITLDADNRTTDITFAPENSIYDDRATLSYT